jgi:hypothetical protein
MIITLRCLSCDRSELKMITTNLPVLTSDARVYESDPRATLLFRRLFFILSLF